MASDNPEEHIPVLENRMDDIVVSEPQTRLNEEEDRVSSVSDAPSVEHFNISVSTTVNLPSNMHVIRDADYMYKL